MPGEEETRTRGTLLPWLLLALVNFAGQAVLRRELAPGEFGTFNALLALIGLGAVPLLGFVHELARHDRPDLLPMTTIATLAWGLVALPGVFLALPLLGLPRFTLDLFTLLNVALALAGVITGQLARPQGALRGWWWLLVGAGCARALAGAALGWSAPFAESALTAVLLAGLLVAMPLVLEFDWGLEHWKTVWRAVDPALLLSLGAAVSVATGLYLFSSADRLLALPKFGEPDARNLGYANPGLFDGYETAGLLGRALLWGTQPLLAIFFLQRVRLERTTRASLRFLWIHALALIFGAAVLSLGARTAATPFGDVATNAHFVPAFALAMVPIGLLQGLGTFALASRRWLECFLIGAGGILYTLPLALAARQPELMLAYMFGGSIIVLLAVVFVGVVRWGRRQP
jgi:hypothetical protein